MKYMSTLKNLVVVAAMGIAGTANAQAPWRPLAFGWNGSAAVDNFYKDYVGTRFQICSPTAIQGDKQYTCPNIGGTGTWSGRGDTTMTCVDIKFAPAGDTDACSSTAFSSGYFAGKVAMVWRGNCEFGCKAEKCQTAGAVAVIIVNNVAGGPVGMAGGACGSRVTIPVYMISLDDGLEITAQMRLGVTPTLTVVRSWGTGKRNDLGFVPAGYSIYANNCMPWGQINANPANGAYAMKAGGFVANYGTNNQSNVKLKSTLNWTPTGGSTSVAHTDSQSLSLFRTTDSIYCMYMPKYSLPTLTGTGKFTLNYQISADSTDGFTGDNSISYNFYATDSLYSKGRYDLANNKPYCTIYTGPSTATTDPYIWSVPYYVANAGSYAKDIQFSVTHGVGLLPTGDQFFTYLFKWVNNVAASPDTFMQNSELELVGTALYTFGATDSSFKVYTAAVMDSNGNPAAIALNANSWYVVAAEAPNTLGYYLGCDGMLSGYPRALGLKKADNIYDFYNPIWFGNRKDWVTSTGTPTSMWANPNSVYYPWSFDGTGSFEIDSVVYDNQKGLIPSLPLITTTHANINAVSKVSSLFSTLELFPNPATNTLNVSIGMDKAASQVTYIILDGSGKSVSHETHRNVQNEVYSLNTSNLASGVYYMIVAADGKTSSRKFTIVK